MQQTLTKYDNGSTTVMDVQEVLFHDTHSFFVSSQSLRVFHKKHVIQTLTRRSQPSICLIFKVTQDLDEIWCSGLIWYWCIFTSYNLYCTWHSRPSVFSVVTQRRLLDTDVSEQPIGQIFSSQVFFLDCFTLEHGPTGCPETSVTN